MEALLYVGLGIFIIGGAGTLMQHLKPASHGVLVAY